jgi:nucleoside 2-deoxyribosyltransferase
MKVIYVAGPYTGKGHGPENYAEIGHNILNAREWAIKILKLGGCVTLTPHLNSAHMECDFNHPEFWYEADLELLKRCDAIFMIPGWERSKGSVKEHGFAITRELPVFYDLESLNSFIRS